MDKWKLKIFIISLFLLPTILFFFDIPITYAFIQGYEGSGFGYSGANIDFCDYGHTSGGYSYFENSTNDYFLGEDGSDRFWTVTDNLMSSSDYYFDAGAGGLAHNYDPTTVPSWTTDGGSNATPPAGTFISIDCDTSTSTATTTPTVGLGTEEWLLIMGIIIYFISLGSWGIIFSPLNQVRI